MSTKRTGRAAPIHHGLAEFCAEYTAHLKRIRWEQNASVINAKNELGRLERNRANMTQAIRDGIPASEVKDDLARIATRREELEAIVGGTKDGRVPLHPNMAVHYPQKVANLATIIRSDENRAEAADLLRSLIDRIELTPNADDKLDIDLFGDIAGILGLAANKNGPR